MPWKRLFLGTLVALNLLLAYALFAGDQGLFAYLDLKGRHDDLAVKLAEQDRAGRELSHEIRSLKSDSSYLEGEIRTRINYMRDDEVLYIFHERARNKAQPKTLGAAANEDQD